jgi:hypothetical protein
LALGSVHGSKRLTRGCQEQAEVLFLAVKQRRQRIQVACQGFAVESGVEVDLVGTLGRSYFDPADPRPLGGSSRSEELLDGTPPLEGAEDEWFCEIAHAGRLRRDEDARPQKGI